MASRQSTPLLGAPAFRVRQVEIVEDGPIGEPGRFGSAELAAALRGKGLEVVTTKEFRSGGSDPVVLAGIPSRATRLRELEHSGGIAVPSSPEAYTIRSVAVDRRPVVVVAGSDERGLMYGLLELERRISHLDSAVAPGRALLESREETGRPEVKVRGMIQFLQSADLEREWYYDPAYWESYLGMLARNRFNSLNLVFAHQTGYLAPPYPFLFNVEKYPQVRVRNLSESDQRRNLAMLQTVSGMCRQRGIEFVMGIW